MSLSTYLPPSFPSAGTKYSTIWKHSAYPVIVTKALN